MKASIVYIQLKSEYAPLYAFSSILYFRLLRITMFLSSACNFILIAINAAAIQKTMAGFCYAMQSKRQGSCYNERKPCMRNLLVSLAHDAWLDAGAIKKG
jgi:hypothetical protein